MDTIKDLLSNRDQAAPPEVKIIKDYVEEKFQANVSITIQPKQIIISAKSAALTGTLRMHSHQIAKACQTDKRLVFRISS